MSTPAPRPLVGGSFYLRTCCDSDSVSKYAAVGGKFNEASHFAERDSAELLGFHFSEYMWSTT